MYAIRSYYETGEEKTILFCLSGHGHFDLSAYEAYNNKKLEDVEYTSYNFV